MSIKSVRHAVMTIEKLRVLVTDLEGASLQIENMMSDPFRCGSVGTWLEATATYERRAIQIKDLMKTLLLVDDFTDPEDFELGEQENTRARLEAEDARDQKR